MANPTVVVFSPTGWALASFLREGLFYEVSFNLAQARFGGALCVCGVVQAFPTVSAPLIRYSPQSRNSRPKQTENAGP